MSSQYIFVRCKTCNLVEQLYTGGNDLNNFQNESYEQEFLDAICDNCEGKDND